jgi:hypothetical protein
MSRREREAVAREKPSAPVACMEQISSQLAKIVTKWRSRWGVG